MLTTQVGSSAKPHTSHTVYVHEGVHEMTMVRIKNAAEGCLQNRKATTSMRAMQNINMSSNPDIVQTEQW
jgi:hypothetical protein